MMNNKKKNFIGCMLLLLTAMIWGFAFVAQKSGMDFVGPITFQWARSILGAVVVSVLCLAKRTQERRWRSSAGSASVAGSASAAGSSASASGSGASAAGSVSAVEGAANVKSGNKAGWGYVILAGALCGLAFTTGSVLQQIALETTDVGKAGFLTSLYLIFVPLAGSRMGKKVTLRMWLCVILAMAGIIVLSGGGLSGISMGEILLLLSAVGFTAQILLVDHFVKKVRSLSISLMQMLMSTLLCTLPVLLLERPSLAQLSAAAIPLLYAGIMSSGVAYTLQIIGQKYADPTSATVFMSMESVFSLIGGILLLNQIPKDFELLGCGMILTAVIMIQLPEKVRKDKVKAPEIEEESFAK